MYWLPARPARAACSAPAAPRRGTARARAAPPPARARGGPPRPLPPPGALAGSAPLGRVSHGYQVSPKPTLSSPPAARRACSSQWESSGGGSGCPSLGHARAARLCGCPPAASAHHAPSMCPYGSRRPMHVQRGSAPARATTQLVVRVTQCTRVRAGPAVCGARPAAPAACGARRHERGLRGRLQHGAVRAGGAGARTRGAAGERGRGRRERLGDEQAGALGQRRVRGRAARRPDARRAGLQAQHLAQAEEPPQQAVGQPGAAPAQPGERCRTARVRLTVPRRHTKGRGCMRSLPALLQKSRAPDTPGAVGVRWAREHACGGLGAVQLCHRRADVEGPPALSHRRRPARVVHTACNMAPHCYQGMCTHERYSTACLSA